MKKFLLLSVLLLPILAPSAQPSKEWITRYARLTKTITTRNLPAFKAFVAEEFVWVMADGKSLNRDEALKEFSPIFKATKITGQEKVLKVTPQGDLVDVSFVTDLLVTYKGQKPVPFHEEGVDTWKKIKGKWMLVKSMTNPEKKEGR